jgi:hypothetical protein
VLIAPRPEVVELPKGAHQLPKRGVDVGAQLPDAAIEGRGPVPTGGLLTGIEHTFDSSA